MVWNILVMYWLAVTRGVRKGDGRRLSPVRFQIVPKFIEDIVDIIE